jgi:hypothetical protein
MTRFSKLTLDAQGKPVETDIRDIQQSDIAKCPHFILMPEHYRGDGSCMCDDPNNHDMVEWGYTWDAKTNMWTGEE